MRASPHHRLDLLVWLTLAGLGLFLSRLTDLDWLTAAQFFDPEQGVFPHRYAWHWAVLGHLGTKYLSIAVALVAVAWLVRNGARQSSAVVTALVYCLVTALVAVAINGQFKAWSPHSCPWDLRGFGGSADYFRMLVSVPTHPGAGHCMPSGHAAVGFMWISAIYAAARWHPAWMRRVALGVISFGLLCGFIQVARGAHFPSHVLMTAVICGLVAAISIRLPIWARLERHLAQRVDLRREPRAMPAA